MKRIAWAGTLAAALAGSAGAADMPPPAPRMAVMPAPVATLAWTGCYVGGHVGSVRNDSELSSRLNDGFTPAQQAVGFYSYSGSGVSLTAGVHYGCNRQFGNFIIGTDSSFSWAGVDESIAAAHPAAGAVLGAYSESLTQRLDWFSTTRGRFGWADDRWMVFVAGGLATGRVESGYAAVFPAVATFGSSQAHSRYGWTLGGGFEYALSANWFARGEYLYVDLGKYSYTSLNAPPTASIITGVNTRFQVVRLGVSYRFTRLDSMLDWALGGFK